MAEGIETAGQMSIMRSLGCDVLQGFYISAPVPAAEIFTEVFLGSEDTCSHLDRLSDALADRPPARPAFLAHGSRA